MRVLVVDDEVRLAETVARGLRAEGFEVDLAHTGPDGLAVAQQWRPDIVLLDIGLPGLDGYEVARRLRTRLGLGGERMRLFALSGYGRDADIALAREAGFEAHLTKPCDLDELERLMIAARTSGEPRQRDASPTPSVAATGPGGKPFARSSS